MKRYLVTYFILYIAWPCFGLSICSWNIENIGQSKSDSEIQFMAAVLKNYDVVAIQEVVAGLGGAAAVARLHDALNRTGSKWDYTVSDPTTGSTYKTERYAYLWKTTSFTIFVSTSFNKLKVVVVYWSAYRQFNVGGESSIPSYYLIKL